MKIIKAFENDNLVVLEKPAGWIVNISATAINKPTLQKYIKDHFSFDIAKDKQLRSGIVHRLDKETSGLIIVAKNARSFEYLQSLFKKREVQKTYVALVHGKVEPTKGQINVPVGRLPWNRERFGVVPGGRKASTEYKVVSYYQKNKELYSLMNLYPKTGRTHQIRIHMKYIGHPLVADNYYAGRKTSKKDRLWCNRLFLHACGLEFKPPESKKSIHVKSEIPKDLKDALGKLKMIGKPG